MSVAVSWDNKINGIARFDSSVGCPISSYIHLLISYAWKLILGQALEILL